MYKYLANLPDWVEYLIILFSCSVILFLCILVWRGISLSILKVVSIDTKTKNGKSRSGILIPADHIVQFSRLRRKIKRDVLDNKNEFYAIFRTMKINALKDSGVSHAGIEKNEELLEYLVNLSDMLKGIFVKQTCSVIFGDHFPERKKNRAGEFVESEFDFHQRFKKEFAKDQAKSIYRLMVAEVSGSWKSKSITFTDFEKNYLTTETTYKMVDDIINSLLKKSMFRRDDLFELITQNDSTDFKVLVSEWEIVYG